MAPRILTAGRMAVFLLVTIAAGLAPAWAQAPRQPQTVTFTPIPTIAQTLSGISFDAFASSGLPVTSFTAGGDVGVCSIFVPPIGTKVIFLTRPGLCTVTASQSGNDQFEPASATVSIEVVLTRLEITFHAVPATAVYGAAFPVFATTTNTSYVPTIAASGACTLFPSPPGYIVRMTSGSGDCALTASHPGDASAEVIPKTVLVAATRRPVTVSALPYWKFEGTPDVHRLDLTYDVPNDSVIYGDAFTGQPSRDPGEAVGTYQLYQGTLSLGPNYDMTFVGNGPYRIVPLFLEGPARPIRLGEEAAFLLHYEHDGTTFEGRCIIYLGEVGRHVFAQKSADRWNCPYRHTYTAAGVYNVVGAAWLGANTAFRATEVVVYDPNGGSVRGDGTYFSAPGTFGANAEMSGIVRFQLESGYASGATVPTGSGWFALEGSDVRFSFVAQEWLVVTGGAAIFRGVGVDHDGAAYGFQVSVVDGAAGAPDKVRLMMWNANGIVYDTQPGAPWHAEPATPLGAGGITVG